MSLLDRGDEQILIFPEVVVTDSDGNVRTMPSTVGIPARARIQIQNQSGTSARRSEQDNEGFEIEEVYQLRLPRRSAVVIDAQARIEWRGEYWAIIGGPQEYNGSRRTRHVEYTIRRN